MKQGDKVIITNGDYSSYTIIGTFTVLKDFDKIKAFEDFFLVCCEEYDGITDYNSDFHAGILVEAFLTWAMKKGLLVSTDYVELHFDDELPTCELFNEEDYKEKYQEILDRRLGKVKVKVEVKPKAREGKIVWSSESKDFDLIPHS